MSFDSDAKNWDTDLRINRARVIADEIGKYIDSDKQYSAMEFGCGTGLISFNLHDKFKNITLIDSSQGMIEILNSKISNYKINNMIPYHLDITNSEASNLNFDVIYNSMVLHHIPDTNEIIKDFYKLLNKEGYLFIVDLDEDDGSFHSNYSEYDGHNGFNQEHLKSILSSAGFKDIESSTFYYGEKRIEEKVVNYSLFLMRARKY
ncbi:class I SAM-dependent DNA methyltransferase [Clostridium omnivorum]|uniref:S-adenosylmethionine-dependent methyltransferase n=1 Tax=Clostridium omnivorum TaxID=1604902 RepID=A0ABQ5N5H8_9CLOT|nr:class I SAM-dependent methyltransferase [Clostridium sp. E14]GLC30396.1 S-adenosylmethionine-dependent methyltransferase [Clostridium sp. E14]